MSKPERLILLLAVLATVAKLYCAWTTVGTSDTANFCEFGRFISAHGLAAMYRQTPLFNHPPLVGSYVGLAHEWSGGHGRVLARFIRVPGIAADLLVIGLLLWLRRRTGRPPWWALALCAASPVSFMISGYHGNFDPLLALGLVLAAVACVQRQPALCGLAFGLSCQVKVAPLLLAPVFFFHWWQRGNARPFTAVAAATVLAGWALPLVEVPELFLKNVLGYSSVWGTWGLTSLLRMTDAPELRGIVWGSLSPLQALVVAALKATVIGGVLVLAWRRRAGPDEAIFSTLALAWLLFFTFAPGFGVQYLAWVLPFFLLHSARWFAALTATSSVALFVFYDSISGGLPWDMGFLVQKHAAEWVPWLLLPWAIFVGCWATLAESRQYLRGIAPSVSGN